LLLEGTGVRVERFEVDGTEIDLDGTEYDMSGPRGVAESYLVKLVRS
jgi:hypothetical protein